MAERQNGEPKRHDHQTARGGVGMKREPRLQFSDADLAEPKLEKPIKRVKKAAAKAEMCIRDRFRTSAGVYLGKRFIFISVLLNNKSLFFCIFYYNL